jgi:hypothetical protein
MKRWVSFNRGKVAYQRPTHVIFYASNREKFWPDITDEDLLLSGWFEQEYSDKEYVPPTHVFAEKQLS